MALGMLARRLREHDWFAALLELLIVIAGILIALQVSNWNQDRQDRALARQYAQRLHGELQSDVNNIALTRVFWKRVAEYQAAASNHAEAGTLVDGSPWKTVLAYY
jgi:ABC-type multidrug transport system fused ATPase/permease subunit